MAREYRPSDAKKLITEHTAVVDALSHANWQAQEHLEEAKQISLRIVAEKVLAVLREIPVEELNRDKKGFRVKVLRDNGYGTIADVAAASVWQLEAINGIGYESAVAIKAETDSLTTMAGKGMKLRLSADDRNPGATALVLSIAKYRLVQYVAGQCEVLLETNKTVIENAVDELMPAQNPLKWVFSSKKTKQKWDDAYAYLQSVREGYYWEQARACVNTLSAAAQLSEEAAWEDFTKNPILFFNIVEKVNPGALGNDDSLYGLPEELARAIQEESYFPDGLLCQLRKYQEWGVRYILHQGRVLLGDEMGLGKTVQAIAAMVSLRNTGCTHFVVVCPAGVLANWCREIRKMSRLSVTQVYGPDRSYALDSWLRTGGVAVTTYENSGFFVLPEDFCFSMLVVDEAHYIKNTSARRSQNVRALCEYADRLLFMTGTALENNVDEMISLMEVLNPDIAEQVKTMASLSTAPQFRKLVAPVYYRRKREDVLTELPDKIETQEWCTMTACEEQIYEKAVLDRNYTETRRVSWNVEDLAESSKAKRLLEIVEEAEAEGRKILVFSFFLDTIRRVQTILAERCTEAITGAVSPGRRQEIIDEFDKAPAGTVLPAQIQSGGTGLNIQSASVVILCEPQFKPSIENQAISRAYRMGQARDVMVHRLLCEDTVDERILEILADKQTIFDAFADKSEAAEAAEGREIDSKTFGDIIQEEIDRINVKYHSAD